VRIGEHRCIGCRPKCSCGQHVVLETLMPTRRQQIPALSCDARDKSCPSVGEIVRMPERRAHQRGGPAFELADSMQRMTLHSALTAPPIGALRVTICERSGPTDTYDTGTPTKASMNFRYSRAL